MALRIKVPHADFESASEDGWIDGLLQGRREIWVYVELGTEQEYISSPNDDPRTEYRLFWGCDAFFAKTQERLEAQDYEAEQYNVTVILYS
ncbi:MAG: hypothetical protein KME60_25805 [Cyanomargarita calcarea GSE-NOS-MK-12-04C]|jgi:hypothetical protein|uniref:Uncharacterized protein n=1 Tax=Cyanomargarita calcarea GSE-NOS-MK-12-04C TaxID=2839659 RepID=A0A951QQQ3_9CYAN|nr:hypothetical protein [Cyanomargarita calcarea GSE-NOS-MK-12-04C]